MIRDKPVLRHAPCQICKTLGSTVSKARIDPYGLTIIKEYNSHPTILDTVIKEINILTKINHPNIIRLLEIWHGEKTPTILLEYGGETIWEFAEIRSMHFRMVHFAEIFGQFFKSLDYLHNNGIIHRDIKPINVLIKLNENVIPSIPIVKLCDFGLSKRCGIMTPTVCTPNYRAPEVLAGILSNDITYDKSIDMWSSACVMCEYLSHTILFPGNTDLLIWSSIMDCVAIEPVNKRSKTYSSLPQPKGTWKPINNIFDIKHYGRDFHNNIYLTKELVKELLSLNPNERPDSTTCLERINTIFGKQFSNVNQGIPFKPTFLIRKTSKVDLNIRHVIVSEMIGFENIYDITLDTIALGIDIFDKWIMITDGSDDLILYSLASIVLASYSSLFYVDPIQFVSVYTEEIILAAVSNLYRTIEYNTDFLHLWALMRVVINENQLPQTDGHMGIYWQRVCELLLDYNKMFAKTQDQIKTVLDTIIY